MADISFETQTALIPAPDGTASLRPGATPPTTFHHDQPPPQLGTSCAASAKDWLVSGLSAKPPEWEALLRDSLAAQQSSRGAFLARDAQFEAEQRIKRGRLDLLKRQQARREAWMAMDAEAVAETAEMLEEMALAVRDRLTSLRPDGYRAFVFHNGDTYEGSWKNCKMHGKGCLRREGPKDVYEGQWFGGQRSGIGSYHCVTFSFFYNGAWLDNRHHGKGELVEPEGTFAGEFTDNVILGYGEYHYQDGHIYRGEWVRGVYHGAGTYLYPSGARYEGQWESGLEHGRGTMLYANGDVYTGDWRWGYPHGTGTYESRGGRGLSGGLRIEGHWLFGRVHGTATCTFADGSVYTGQWARDQLDGEGRLTCPTPPPPPLSCSVPASPPGLASFTSPNAAASSKATEAGVSADTARHGIVYRGGFHRGRRDGYGVYTSDTVSYDGYWQDGRKGGGLGAIAISGCGTLTIPWDHDMPYGDGTYTTGAGDEQPVVSGSSPLRGSKSGDGTASRRVDVRLVAENMRTHADGGSEGTAQVDSVLPPEPLD